MNIDLTELTALLLAAQAEGYDDGFGDGYDEGLQSDKQLANSIQGANEQTYEAQPESLKSNAELPLPEDVNPDEEAFALYSDAFDDGYSEAIADVKESLDF